MGSRITLLSSRSEDEEYDISSEIVPVHRTGTVLEVLASETARQVLATLYEGSKTASEIADDIDSSVQNVSYHLDNLREANLIVAVDTWYSSKGRKMRVYAPAAEPMILLIDEAARHSLDGSSADQRRQ